MGLKRRALVVLACASLGASIASGASATPVEAEKLRGRARAAMLRYEYKEAVELLERARKADPTKLGILKDLAVALAGDGKTDEAAAKYREYLKTVPDDEAAFLAMASTLSWGKERAQRDEAEKLLTEYLAKHPENDDAILQRARVRSWSGQIEGAEFDFGAYLARHPNDDKVKLELASALASKKDPGTLARAIAMYDAHLAAHPDDHAALLQRARVRSWANQIPEATADYRAYLKAKPDDADAGVELARVLAWSARLEDQREAIAILDKRLAAKPEDEEARAARARAGLGIARLLAGSKKPEERAEGLATLEAYAAAHPEDEKLSLEIAMALASSTDKASLLRAVAIYDAWLEKHPDDLGVLLRRGRVRAWAGQTNEAIADFRAWGAKTPGDDSYLLEIANALSQSRKPADAIPAYDAYLAKHPSDFDARARRARTLLWIGDYGRAEVVLTQLVREAKTDAERTTVEVDLARLYAQTGRRYHALDLLDRVLEREATNEAARRERERVASFVRSRLEPRFFAYDDKARITIFAAIVEGRAAIGKHLSVIGDVGGWSLGTAQETFFATRANLGLGASIKYVELEAAAGPRLYQYFDSKAGGRALARVSPTGWASAALAYQYDDIYFDMLQPASVPAGVRGHALHLSGDVTLPLRIRTVGRIGARSLSPDNRGLEMTGTVMVPVTRPFYVGYNVQFLTWEKNDFSYWSPQQFAAHLGVLRAAQTFFRSGFGYDLQAVLGVAGERIRGAPEAGFGPSFGGSGAVIYSPFPRLELRLGVQYSQTVRELPQAVTGGTIGPAGSPVTSKSPSRYYWVTATASAIFYL